MPSIRDLKRHAPALCGLAIMSGACARPVVVGSSGPAAGQPDVQAIVSVARELADDSLKGRGPWTPENERAARMLANRLEALGARPVFGTSLLVPFTDRSRPMDTVYNVVGVIPGKTGTD